MNHCLRHYEEPIAAHCRACSQPFCTRCLVFSFGPSKPPYCVGCALHASGIRNGNRAVEPVETAAAEMVPDRKAMRAMRRAERSAVKAAAREEKRAASGRPAPAPVGHADPAVPGSPHLPAASPLLARNSTGAGQI